MPPRMVDTCYRSGGSGFSRFKVRKNLVQDIASSERTLCRAVTSADASRHVGVVRHDMILQLALAELYFWCVECVRRD